MEIMVTCFDHRRRLARVNTKPGPEPVPGIVRINGQEVAGTVFPTDGLEYLFR